MDTYFDTKLLIVSTALSNPASHDLIHGLDALVIRQFLVSHWPPDYIPLDSVNCFLQINDGYVEQCPSAFLVFDKHINQLNKKIIIYDCQYGSFQAYQSGRQHTCKFLTNCFLQIHMVTVV